MPLPPLQVLVLFRSYRPSFLLLACSFAGGVEDARRPEFIKRNLSLIQQLVARGNSASACLSDELDNAASVAKPDLNHVGITSRDISHVAVWTGFAALFTSHLRRPRLACGGVGLAVDEGQVCGLLSSESVDDYVADCANFVGGQSDEQAAPAKAA